MKCTQNNFSYNIFSYTVSNDGANDSPPVRRTDEAPLPPFTPRHLHSSKSMHESFTLSCCPSAKGRLYLEFQAALHCVHFLFFMFF